MPIYEYRCESCEEPISIWYSSVSRAESQPAVCTICGSTRLTRLISRVTTLRSTTPSPATASAAAASPVRNDDPQSLARTMHAASAGRPMGQDFQEVASRLAKGESARSVETSLRKRVGEAMDPH